MTLQEILEFAVEHGACEPQLNKFIDLITKKDDLQAWQTVFYYLPWFFKNGLDFSNDETAEIAKKANYIGKSWFSTGAVSCEYGFNSEGVRHGLSKEYRSNGLVAEEKNYKNGVSHGKTTIYKFNGEIAVQYEVHEGKVQHET